MKKIRVGILGGSFNPPHSGHLLISRLAIKRLGLKQLWWIPTLQNPLKNDDIRASYKKRLELCKKLTENNPAIKVKEYEQEYTYDLLKRLNQLYPNYEFFFIMGADSLINFHKWYKYKELHELARIIVFARPGYKNKALKSKAAIQGYYDDFVQEITSDASSTKLRAKKDRNQ